jgi:hypothetical protein
MADTAITVVSPEAEIVRSHGGRLNVSWRDSAAVSAPAQFGIWLVDVPSNGWYGGFVFDADGSGSYSEEIHTQGGFPDNVALTPVVYYRDSPSAGWGGTSGLSYDMGPATVTLLSFALTGANPAHAVAGTPVTIRGTGFTGGASAVYFGDNLAPRFVVASDAELVAYVPPGVAAGLYDLYVTSDGFTVGGASFTIDASPTGPVPNIAAIDPGSAEPGEVVAITGSGLSTLTSLTFGASGAAFEVVSDAELAVLVPRNEGTVMVTATNPYGSDAFEFIYPAQPVPVVTSVAPAKGYPGDAVTITGTGFLTASGVSLGAHDAGFLIADDALIAAYVPAGIPSGDCQVTVMGPGGASIEPVMFSVGAYNLPITTASPVSSNGFEGWVSGEVMVTLTADANGGPGVAATFYALDSGGVTPYTAPFLVSGAGSHHLIWWSVDVRGRVEPPRSGYVNILSASLVPTGLSVVPAGFDAVLIKWTAAASDSPVSYRLYQGPSAAGPWTMVADTNANVVTVPQPAADGPHYYAAAGVDVNGSESDKSAAFGPITAEAVPMAEVDWAAMPPITVTKIADGAIETPKLAANAVTAAKVDVADLQAAIVTASKVNTLALNASVISAGTIATARLDVVAIQAATVTAAAVNALALSAGSITAGTLSADRIAGSSITAAKLNVADVQAAVVTAAAINALSLSAVNITGGNITGVVVQGGTIRTAAANLRRVELSSADQSNKFYSADSVEQYPGTIAPYVYGGGGAGGYLYLKGPQVSGQALYSYISLHGTSTRRDILIAALGGASVTIGPSDDVSKVAISGKLSVSDLLTASAGINTGTAGIAAAGSVIAGITLSGNVISGATDVQAGRFYPTANCASGVSADGVWINDLNTPSRRWKLYMTNAPGAYVLYARYGSGGTEYRNIGP